MREINEMAKELGEKIKEDERTKRLQLAELAVQADMSMQDKMKEFNELRDRMMGLMEKGVDDRSIIDPLNAQIKELYGEITGGPAMKEYNQAKTKFDEMMQNVNNIIMFYVTGELPGCDPSDCAGCGGGCG